MIKNYVVALVLLLTSCATVGIRQNYIPTDLTDQQQEIIANDIVPLIVQYNPAKTTKFILKKDVSKYRCSMGTKLANKLQHHGYIVGFSNTNVDTPNDTRLISYIIDWIDGNLYIALTINDIQKITRVYQLDQGTIRPLLIKIIGTKDE